MKRPSRFQGRLASVASGLLRPALGLREAIRAALLAAATPGAR